jgi:hypothetical protein
VNEGGDGWPTTGGDGGGGRTAEEVGLDPGRLARLDAYLDGFGGQRAPPGLAAAITRGGRIAHVSQPRAARRAGRPAGRARHDLAHLLDDQADHSVAAMLLYEEGALSLFDPVAKFIPCFEDLHVYRHGMAAAPVTARAAEPMLVWHLLTHTSGLTYGFQQANAVDEAYRAAGFFLDPPPEHDLASAVRSGPGCRSCSSPAPSGTTRSRPTCWGGSSRSSPASRWTSSSPSASSRRWA